MPDNKNDQRVRAGVGHFDKIIVEEGGIQFAKDGVIKTSGGGSVHFQPEGDGKVFVRDDEVGSGLLSFEDEGTPQGTAPTLNVVGAGAAVTVAGGKATLNVGGASGVLEIQKDGSKIDDASILNFLRNGMTVDVAAGIADITVPGLSTVVVQASPNFTADDDLLQYPTVAQALAKADALKTAGAPFVAVKIDGEFPEENLQVNNGVRLIATPGAARITGVAAPTSVPLVALDGLSSIYGIDLFPQAANPGEAIITTKGSALDARIARCRIGDYSNNWGAGIRIEERAVANTFAFLKNNFVFGVLDYGVEVMGVKSGCYNGAIGMMFGTAGNAVIRVLNGTYTGPVPVNGFYIWNSAVKGLSVFTPYTFSMGSFARAVCHNCDVDLNSIQAPNVAQVSITSPEFMYQSYFPDPGLPGVPVGFGSVQHGFSEVRNELTDHDNRIYDNQANVGFLAAGLARVDDISAEDFDGMVVEDFVDDAGMDLPNSFGYTLEGQKAKFYSELVDDDFEGYANTAALVAAWVPQDVSVTVTLETGGAYQGTKFMRFTGSSSASGKTVTRDFGAGGVDYTVHRARTFAARGSGSPQTFSFQWQIQDVDGRLATSLPISVPNSGPWVKYTIPKNSMTIQSGFKWFAVRYVRIVVGTIAPAASMTWDFDVPGRQRTGRLVNPVLIDNCETLTPANGAWSTVSGPTLTLTPSANSRQGSNHFSAVFTGVATSFEYKRTWTTGYMPDVQYASVVEFWWRTSSVTVGGNIPTPFLYLKDAAGNEVSIVTGGGVGVLTVKPFLTDSVEEWRAFTFNLSEAQYVTQVTTFNPQQIVEMRLVSNGGVTGQFTWGIDYIRIGDPGIITAEDSTIDDTDELRSFFPLAASKDQDVLLEMAKVSSPNGFGIIGALNGSVQVGRRGDTDWAVFPGSNTYAIWRLVASKDAEVAGVSTIWR